MSLILNRKAVRAIAEAVSKQARELDQLKPAGDDVQAQKTYDIVASSLDGLAEKIHAIADGVV